MTITFLQEVYFDFFTKVQFSSSTSFRLSLQHPLLEMDCQSD